MLAGHRWLQAFPEHMQMRLLQGAHLHVYSADDVIFRQVLSFQPSAALSAAGYQRVCNRATARWLLPI